MRALPTPIQVFVIAGLDPAIHAEVPHLRVWRMDARVKPAHDELKSESAAPGRVRIQ
jgi:hypothetical protein